jgi:hypothetical protein
MRMIRVFAALSLLAVFPVATAAQQIGGAIAGVVRDTSGAVVPGVTVEVSSPALIEKSREAVTDGSGQYKIVSLPPGTYSIRFTLSGFNIVERPGIVLTTNFTAAVNADLKPGSLEETVTVSGEAPVVDVQNVQKTAILNREVTDTIPAPRVWSGYAALLPGVTLTANNAGAQYDVGGGGGVDGQRLRYQGSSTNDIMVALNGMPIVSEANSTSVAPTDLFLEETAVGLGSQSAESETGGVRTNFVPRSGGNRFSLQAYLTYTDSNLQGKNVTAEQFAQGVPYQNGINALSEVAVAGGGPILRDKAWFFGAGRYVGTNRQSPVFYDTVVDDWVYIPDTARGAVEDTRPQHDYSGKVTWQVTQRDKVSVNFTVGNTLRCCNSISPTSVLENSDRTNNISKPVLQGNWSRAVNSRLLFEAGGQYSLQQYDVPAQPTAVFPAVTETSTGISFRSKSGRGNRVWQSTKYYSHYAFLAISYVTGSHAFKGGVQIWPGHETQYYYGSGPYAITLLNGVPTAVTYFADPRDSSDYFFKTGAFLQDQWTLKRMTVSAGLRFDSHNGWYPDQHLVATMGIPARDYPGQSVNKWLDLSPRVGVAWDVFGDGRTAVKASVNRYVANAQTDLARAVTPGNQLANGLRRSWVDANKDFIPQGDPLNPLPNGELTGASPNVNFGTPVLSTRNDPASAMGGWGARGYNWSYAASVDHQVVPNVGVTGAYFFRTFGNQTITDNTLVSPSDYDTYCVTSPIDSRLPGGGGQQICGLYDLKPSAVGKVDNLSTFRKNYGKYIEHYSGMELSANLRLKGLNLRGGVSLLKSITDNCDVVTKVDNPSERYCRQETPYMVTWKFFGFYNLPWAFQVSGTLQATPGTSVAANWVAVNSEIAPSLGRNLSGGSSNVTINLVEPQTQFLGNVTKVDLRFSRKFKWGRVKASPVFDIYNVTNANPAPSFLTTYGTTAGKGATWLNASAVLSPRLMKFGVQLEF